MLVVMTLDLQSIMKLYRENATPLKKVALSNYVKISTRNLCAWDKILKFIEKFTFILSWRIFFQECNLACKQHKQLTQVPRKDAKCVLFSLNLGIYLAWLQGL